MIYVLNKSTKPKDEMRVNGFSLTENSEDLLNQRILPFLGNTADL